MNAVEKGKGLRWEEEEQKKSGGKSVRIGGGKEDPASALLW